MSLIKNEKFVTGRVTGYVVSYGSVALARIFDENALLVFSDDNYPTAQVDELIESWCVEKVFSWKGIGR